MYKNIKLKYKIKMWAYKDTLQAWKLNCEFYSHIIQDINSQLRDFEVIITLFYSAMQTGFHQCVVFLWLCYFWIFLIYFGGIKQTHPGQPINQSVAWVWARTGVWSTSGRWRNSWATCKHYFYWHTDRNKWPCSSLNKV